MPRFTFAIGNGSLVREVGSVQRDSFTDALAAIGQEITVEEGDTLEIGVRGFPPARYQCLWPMEQEAPTWLPRSLAA
jgi:hypothetical protein